MSSSKKGGARVTRNTLKTAARLLKYVTIGYKVQFIIVILCILMCSVSTISVSLSLRFLLDDYIIPLIGNANPDFGCTGLYLCSGRHRLLHLQPDDGCHRSGRTEKSPG